MVNPHTGVEEYTNMYCEGTISEGTKQNSSGSLWKKVIDFVFI